MNGNDNSLSEKGIENEKSIAVGLSQTNEKSMAVGLSQTNEKPIAVGLS